MNGTIRRAFLAAMIGLAAPTAAGGCGDEPKPDSAPPRPQPTPSEERAAPPSREHRAGAGREVPSEADSLVVASGGVGGVVVGGDADAPVPDFPVFLLGGFTADDLPWGETRTAADGTFAFAGVPAGRVRVVAMGPIDGTERRADAVLTVAAKETATARLRLVTPDAPGALELRGRVVWADSGEPVGRFTFQLWQDDGEPVDVRGRDGAFGVLLPSAGEWRVLGMTADGKKDDSLHEEFVVPHEGELLLRVHRPGEATIRVVDAVTGAALPTARAYSHRWEDDGPHFDAGHQVPNSRTAGQTPRSADADGRIVLGRGTGASQWYVVADGHEWFALSAPHGTAEPTEVRLRPAGSLRLSVPRWRELEAASIDTGVRFHRRLALPRPDAKGDLRVEGLLPGQHEIVVRRGLWFEDGVVYGKGVVEIVAGVEAQLVIDADAGERRKKVAVTGTLVVPEAWGEWPDQIRFEGDETANADFDERFRLAAPASGRTMSFQIEVPEGRYRLLVDPFQWRRAVEVSAGAANLELDLGAPAELAVTVVDDGTGRPVPGAGVSWYTKIPGQSGWSPESARRPGADGAFVLRAPPGTVHLDASAPGHVDADDVAEATAGERKPVTIRLKSGAVLLVRFESDGKPFLDFQPMVYIGQAGRSFGRTSRRGSVRFDGVEAGTYEVTVDEDDIPGWTCAPQDVDVRSGDTATVVLQFVRKP